MTQSNRKLRGGGSLLGSVQVGLSNGLENRDGCNKLRLGRGQKQKIFFLLQHIDEAPFLVHEKI